MILAHNCSTLGQISPILTQEQSKRVGENVFEKILGLVIGSFIEVLNLYMCYL